MGLLKRSQTTEETYQATVVQPQQQAQAARTAQQVQASTRTGWRDRGTPEEQARIGYGPNHPKHPRNNPT
jgi:hypothetical protein